MPGPMPRNRYMVVIVFLTFFVMSLLTNILGPIVPDIISSFHVGLAAAAFLPFSFFIAYGVMSIPAGFMVERFGEKAVMIAAFVAGTAGSLSFALHPTYNVAVGSLFIMGSGMATLQTAINPLLRVAGGEENFAFNSALAQLIFGSASFLSPYMYSYLALNLGTAATRNDVLLSTLSRLTPSSLPWASMYWIFAVFTVAMIVVLYFSRFPRVERVADEQAGSWYMYGNLFRTPLVWGFFFLCLRLCRFRAGRCRLDVEISFAVSRLRSAHDRGCGGVVVLGLAYSRLFYRNVAAEDFRQPLRAEGHLHRGSDLFVCGAIRTGAGLAYCIPSDRIIRFRHVADPCVTRIEFGCRASWIAGWNP